MNLFSGAERAQSGQASVDGGAEEQASAQEERALGQGEVMTTENWSYVSRIP